MTPPKLINILSMHSTLSGWMRCILLFNKAHDSRPNLQKLISWKDILVLVKSKSPWSTSLKAHSTWIECPTEPYTSWMLVARPKLAMKMNILWKNYLELWFLHVEILLNYHSWREVLFNTNLLKIMYFKLIIHIILCYHAGGGENTSKTNLDHKIM